MTAGGPVGDRVEQMIETLHSEADAASRAGQSARLDDIADELKEVFAGALSRITELESALRGMLDACRDFVGDYPTIDTGAFARASRVLGDTEPEAT